MSIVVTGATGALGSLIVDELVARGVPAGDVVAAGRNPDKLAAVEAKGVRTARIDFDDPESLVTAFRGADKLLFVSNSDLAAREGQHRNAVEAAVAAGVGHILYTSIPRADLGLIRFGSGHYVTEQAIQATGLPYTFLRNGWYHENYVPTLQQAAQTGVVLASVGDGRVASAARADFAAATAAVLSGDGHEGRVYELTGDVAWNYDDLAAACAQALGREVVYRRATPDEHRQALLAAGLPEPVADFVVALDADIKAGGALDQVNGELSRLAGRPTTPLAETLRAFA